MCTYTTWCVLIIVIVRCNASVAHGHRRPQRPHTVRLSNETCNMNEDPACFQVTLACASSQVVTIHRVFSTRRGPSCMSNTSDCEDPDTSSCTFSVCLEPGCCVKASYTCAPTPSTTTVIPSTSQTTASASTTTITTTLATTTWSRTGSSSAATPIVTAGSESPSSSTATPSTSPPDSSTSGDRNDSTGQPVAKPHQDKKKGETTDAGLVGGLTVAVLVVVVAVVVVVVILVRRRRREEAKSPSSSYDNRGYGVSQGLQIPPAVGPDYSEDDAGYADIQDVCDTVYNEPADALEVSTDEYNRINFRGKEFDVDPGYGTLDHKQMPVRDLKYSHMVAQPTIIANNYSHIPITFTNVCVPSEHDRSEDNDSGTAKRHHLSPTIGDDSATYNRLMTPVKQSRETGQEDDDDYCHLGKGRGAAPGVIRPGDTGYTAVYIPGPDTAIASNETESFSYELAQPITEGFDSPTPESTNKDAQQCPDRSENGSNDSCDYELAKPIPGEESRLPGSQYELAKPIDNAFATGSSPSDREPSSPTLRLNEDSDQAVDHSYFILEPVTSS